MAISIYESLFSDPYHDPNSFPLRNDCSKWHSFAGGHRLAKRLGRLHDFVEHVYQCPESRCDNQQRQSREREPAGKRFIGEHQAIECERTGRRAGHANGNVHQRHDW